MYMTKGVAVRGAITNNDGSTSVSAIYALPLVKSRVLPAHSDPCRNPPKIGLAHFGGFRHDIRTKRLGLVQRNRQLIASLGFFFFFLVLKLSSIRPALKANKHQ